jgi:hypothetical protein
MAAYRLHKQHAQDHSTRRIFLHTKPQLTPDKTLWKGGPCRLMYHFIFDRISIRISLVAKE